MPHLSGGRIGFGTMLLPTSAESRTASIAVVRRAVELGVPLVNMACLCGRVPIKRPTGEQIA